jgi:hypothetical protein
MIQRKLGLENLKYSDDQLKEWLSEDGREEHDMTESLIYKKMKNIDYTALSGEERLKIKDKTLRYLLSKGHRYEQAKGAIERYIRSSDQY